ncbi:MAG: TIGR04255 family protein [Candidatus Brocadiaceae bacterium]|nr:TIGR04255 family protein [Candidatus Brocadiaceae bacterium]
MDLPRYKSPPINEVCCGMKFHPSDKLRVPHIGSLWEQFRADYPIIQHAPPLASVKGDILVDGTTGVPLPRVWFINETGDQLVQFQIDRFYFNWRRRQGDYPRYGYIIDKFEKVQNIVKNVFSDLELGELNPIEYELSYTNHIPMGQGWDTIDDFPKIFSDFVWKQANGRFLPNPENVAWQAVFPLKENGSLTVNLKQAIRSEDKVPVLSFVLNARGIGESMSKEGIREWFDLAHEWIVRGFTDLTTSEIQKIWERE